MVVFRGGGACERTLYASVSTIIASMLLHMQRHGLREDSVCLCIHNYSTRRIGHGLYGRCYRRRLVCETTSLCVHKARIQGVFCNALYARRRAFVCTRGPPSLRRTRDRDGGKEHKTRGRDGGKGHGSEGDKRQRTCE